MIEQHPLVVWGWRLMCGVSFTGTAVAPSCIYWSEWLKDGVAQVGGLSGLVLGLLYLFQDKLVSTSTYAKPHVCDQIRWR